MSKRTYNEHCIDLLTSMIDKEEDSEKAKTYVDERAKIRRVVRLSRTDGLVNKVYQGKVKPYPSARR